MTTNTKQKKQEFFRLIVKGWKEQKLKFATGKYYDRNTGGYCALGVAAKAKNPSLVLDGTWEDHDRVKFVLRPYWEAVATHTQTNVALTNNQCHTKGEAMRKIRQVLGL